MSSESLNHLSCDQLLVMILAVLCTPIYVFAEDEVANVTEAINIQPKNDSTARFNENLIAANSLDCSNFIASWDMNDLPVEIQNMPGDPAEQPTDVHVEFYKVKPTDIGSNYLKVFWRFPIHPKVETKAFLIYRDRFKQNQIDCFISLYNASDPPIDEVHSFNIPEALAPEVDAAVYVVSVPPPAQRPLLPNENQVLIKSGYLKHDNNTNSSLEIWSPNVAVRSLNQTTLEVTFTGNEDLVPGGNYEILIHKSKTENAPAEIVTVGKHCAPPDSGHETCVLVYPGLSGDVMIQIRGKDDACQKICASTSTEVFSMHLLGTPKPPSPEVISSTATATLSSIQTLLTEQEQPTETPATTSHLFTRPRVPSTSPLPSSTPQSNGLSTEDYPMFAPAGARIRRPQNARDGGLVGAIVAAALFTVLVVVMAALDRKKPKTIQKTRVKPEP